LSGEISESQKIINIDNINSRVSKPVDVFATEFSKAELRKIRDDTSYYIKNRRYIENIAYLKPRTLPEKIMQEDEGEFLYQQKKKK